MSGDKHQSRGSAFSRLANYVPNPLSSSSASATSLSSGGGSQASSSSRAVDALGALASADSTGRLRHQSNSGSSAGNNNEATLSSSLGIRGKNADGSRSREREKLRREVLNGSNMRDRSASPAATALNVPSTNSWNTDGQQLPPNAYASTSYSAFSSFAGGSAFAFSDGSAFFNAGVSAFSFEGAASLAPDGAFAAGSYGYPIGSVGSPSIFREPGRRFSSAGRTGEGIPNFSSSSLPSAAKAPSSGSGLSWDSSPNNLVHPINEDNMRRGTRMGGGRKPKEASRGLRYSVGTLARDRGMVGLAKPREGDMSRVAVAGKTCLKILRVPSGEPETSAFDRPSFRNASSIAYRRSRSRGSPSVVGSSPGDTEATSSKSKEEIDEILDVRSGSKLGPAYLFSDVRWGYGATSNKIATSFTNGAVVLWDLAKSGASKLDQLKYEHDRAVNRVVFGGASGSWVLSGGQDGQMKLWDIRESRPASLILKASSPVRHLAFSPSPAQPFTLLAVCSSGTLIRYDIRYTGRQGGAATDRIAGHVGSCLAMDWRDNFDGERGGVDSDRNEGGWVVTGGLDGTVKIWDFSLTTLSTKPTRTLYTSQPVQTVAWHPSRATEIASSPLPSLSVDGTASELDNKDFADTSTAKEGSSTTSWKNEIEIWDTRRPYFPKVAIKTEEAVSAVIYNDDDTVWSTSKTSATFQQHDIASDSYALIDSMPRASASWNIDAEMIFVDDKRSVNDTPFNVKPSIITEENSVNAPKFNPRPSIAAVKRFDPDFNPGTFAFLAQNLVVSGSNFADVCDSNAEASIYAERADASQVWAMLRIWLSDEANFAPDTPPEAPNIREELAKSTSIKADDWLAASSSPSFGPNLVQPVTPTTKRSLSLTTKTSLSRGRSSATSPAEAVQTWNRLDDFSEESNTSGDNEFEKDGQPSLAAALSLSDSETEKDAIMRFKRNLGHVNGTRSANGATLTDHNRSKNPSAAKAKATSPGHVTEEALVEGLELLQMSTAGDAPKYSRRFSSSDGSDSDDNDERLSRARTARLAAQARRRSSSKSTKDRSNIVRETTGRNLRQASSEGGLLDSSRRESNTRSTTDGNIENHMKLDLSKLRREAEMAHTEQLSQIVKTQIKATLQDYANAGDSQLCATVCCVLRDKDMDFDPFFVARVTKAYVEMLRRARLYTAAASILKYSGVQSLRSLTQNSVVFHMACGKCGKSLDQNPYGTCSRCAKQITKCAVCHLLVRDLLLFCATCGHGAHPDCLADYASSLTAQNEPNEKSSSADVSHPSTPGIAAPLRAWMWGEEANSLEVSPDTEIDHDQIAQLLASCPVGLCGHSPCILGNAR